MISLARQHANCRGRALDDSSNRAEFQFTITYSPEELRAYQRIMAGRYARVQSEGTAFGLLLGAILVLGLAVFGTFRLGLFDLAAVRPVLFTAYFAFLTGVTGYYFVMRAYFRKFMRTDQRGGTWDFSFTPSGIFYRNKMGEVRLAWRAVNAVEDLGKVVVLRFGPQGITIPTRVFANNAERAAFVAAASAWRLQAAAEKA